MDHQSFYVAVMAYCGLMNASQTSGYRTQAHNAEVGGVNNSLHLVGLAVDVVYDNPISSGFRESIAKRLGLLLIEEGDHDHLQPIGA